MRVDCSITAGQGRAGQGRAGQGRAGQGRAGQGRAGQGRAVASDRKNISPQISRHALIDWRVEFGYN
jgi:hypothetical protein